MIISFITECRDLKTSFERFKKMHLENELKMGDWFSEQLLRKNMSWSLS